MEKKDDENSSELDFASPQFNPLAALYAEGLEPPCPEVRGFQSLYEYENFVRGKKSVKYTQPSTQVTTSIEHSGKDAAELVKKRSQTKQISFMESPRHGPLGCLQQWYRDNNIVRVWIRHSAGVRGVCLGRLIAFDKHWNVVLADVEETFVPFDVRNLQKTKKKKKKRSESCVSSSLEWTPCNQATSQIDSQSGDRITCTTSATPPESSGFKLGYCTELYRKLPSVLTRSLAQLFIRGDNIVMVAKIHSHNT